MAANKLTSTAIKAYDLAMPVISRALQKAGSDTDTIQVCHLAETYLIRTVQDAWRVDNNLDHDDVDKLSVLEIREKM